MGQTMKWFYCCGECHKPPHKTGLHEMISQMKGSVFKRAAQLFRNIARGEI